MIIGRDKCDDCGAPATVATSRVCLNADGNQQAPVQANYCRPCAERHGVPPRSARQPRAEPKVIDWNQQREFLELFERAVQRQPAQRADLRDYASFCLQFMDHAPGPVPADYRALVTRILQDTA